VSALEKLKNSAVGLLMFSVIRQLPQYQGSKMLHASSGADVL
jgi:hypothetical protein